MPNTRNRGGLNTDRDGLSVQQRAFLQELRLVGSWQAAAMNCHVTAGQVRNWLRAPKFKEAYDKEFAASEEVNITRRELTIVASDAVRILEELKDAETDKIVKVEVTCPECDHSFKTTVTVRVMDARTRLSVADMLLKSSKVWNNDVKVEHDVQVTYKLSAAEALALRNLEHGRAIPPAMYNRLKELSDQYGFELKALPSPAVTNTVDGEFSVVEEDDDNGSEGD